MSDYCLIPCLNCHKLFGWLPNKENRGGCLTCGLCDECLKKRGY